MVNDDTEMLQSVLAYNLMVIKALWKSKWGNFGESTINGNVYDFSSLYRSIEKGKETIRVYIQCRYRYKEKSMCNWAERIEGKTGIPKERFPLVSLFCRILLRMEFCRKCLICSLRFSQNPVLKQRRPPDRHQYPAG